MAGVLQLGEQCSFLTILVNDNPYAQQGPGGKPDWLIGVREVAMLKTPEMMVSVLEGAQAIVEEVDRDHESDDRLFAVIAAIETVKVYIERFTDDGLSELMRISTLRPLKSLSHRTHTQGKGLSTGQRQGRRPFLHAKS